MHNAAPAARDALLDSLTRGGVPYQDIWINGAVAIEGMRECESRYSVVRQVLQEIGHPARVLDLGANSGYFGIRIAEEFPDSRVVMVDDAPQLPRIAAANGLANASVVRAKASPDVVRAIGGFDLAIAFSMLHYTPYREMISALCEASPRVLLEVQDPRDENAPANGRRRQIHDEAISRGGEVLQWTPYEKHGMGKRRPIILISSRGLY